MLFHDPQAEAAGRLVADLAEYLGVPLSASMAQALYVAIATDTGWFRFPSTRSSTHQVVARLLEAGACPSEIYRQLYERDSWSRAQLRSRVLARLTLDLEGRLAHTYLVNRDFEETGADRSDTEDFVNMALTLDGTRAAVMLTEQVGGSVKLSLRSRGDAVDCNRTAALFGGGGHHAAAGATISGGVAEVRIRVIEALRPQLTD
jgi:phosphoesterase RecJ-like protein